MNPVHPDMTIPDLLRNVIKNIHPETHTFLLEKKTATWEEISYQSAIKKIDAISAYLLAMGIKKNDRLALLLGNSSEYVYFDQALQQIGAINVSIYPTLTEYEIEYILQDSGAKTILVGNLFLFKKVLKISNACPALIRIITSSADVDRQPIPEGLTAGVISFSNLLEEGQKELPSYEKDIIAARAGILPSDLSTLIYTSGTTGTPKGVMLTHHNLVNNVRVCLEQIPVIDQNDLFLSFLPLSHVFERTATYHVCLACGCTIAFAQSLEALATNMAEVKPTVMNCVPRLLERIYDKAMRSGTEAGGMKTGIFLWALKKGKEYRQKADRQQRPGPWLGIQKSIAQKLVFDKIKAKTGGRLKFMISGGGALPKNIGEFFGNIDIKVLEGFGLTETSPVVAVTEYHRQVFGTVGRIVPGLEVGIQNYETQEIYTVQTHDTFKVDFESEEGEIIVRGHCVMKGYWNKQEETANVIDQEGWFHTGDIGRFHKGNLQITDRLKNMLVNSFGKNIYPTPVENSYLKSNRIEQIFLIGDRREYVTAIIVPSREILQETFGLGEEFFERKEAFINDPGIIDWVHQDIKRLSNELAKFERIRHFKLKRSPFSMENGEMTPTLKIKRKVVEQRYAEVINELYDES